jgi:CxxC motif-containing protein (DUF1111 family)
MKRLLIVFVCAALLNSCGGASNSEIPTAEPGEELSGGDTTVFINTGDSFNQFAANLTFSQQETFKIGNSFFEQNWVTAPSTTTARDGLGAVFNASSCAACHAKDGRGAPPEPGEDPLGILLRLSVPGEAANGGPLDEAVYGGQLNNHSILGVPAEGTFSVGYEEVPGEYADGTPYSLRRPTYTIFDLAFGDLDPNVLVSPRVAPQMVGMGLLEAVPESEITANADPDDADGDGISGKANYVWDQLHGATALGRFGWKANVPTVDQQVAGAFLGDIGITSSIFPDENCTAAQPDCQAAPNGGSPEIEEPLLQAVIFYSKTLAVPGRRDFEDATVLRGKAVFNEVGCARCHLPQMTTEPAYAIPQLAGQTIRPFTDLLVHDMGDGLADGRPDFLADGNEWRTPPLWGIGLIEKVNGHTNLLHDGRARNAEEAVLWHGGEGEASKEAFRGLSAEDRDALIRYLNSL